MNIEDSKFYKITLKNKSKWLSLAIYIPLAITILLFSVVFQIDDLKRKVSTLFLKNIIDFIPVICFVLIFFTWIKYFKIKHGKRKNSPKATIINNIKYFIEANKLYETTTIQRYDSNNKIKTEKIISNSACIGYYEDDVYIILRAYKNADMFNDKVSNLDSGLSALLSLPIENKVNTISYCDYIFKKRADRRINVSSNEKSYNNIPLLPLNSNLSWDISKQPHALICGGTGSGKTYFLNYLILEFLKKHSELYICDPKNSDLGQLKAYLGADKVATDGNNIAKICRLTNEAMEQRYTEMNDNFVYGSNYIDHNYNPIVLIFDELGAFRASADRKTYDETMAYLKAIILKGRQAGVFVILATQQPNANNVPTEIRDNLSMIVALGNMSNQGYQMCFGETVKELQSISGAGCGYIYLDGKGWEKPRYYEAPYIDKNFNFIEEIKKYIK